MAKMILPNKYIQSILEYILDSNIYSSHVILLFVVLNMAKLGIGASAATVALYQNTRGKSTYMSCAILRERAGAVVTEYG